MIIIFCGLAGTGKTYYSRLLAEKTGIAVIETDLVEKNLLTSYDSYFSCLLKYPFTYEFTKKILESGHSVILDGTFSEHATRDKFSKLSIKYNEKVFFIKCTCREKTAVKRIVKRNKELPGFFKETANYHYSKNKFEYLLHRHFLINTELDWSSNLKKIADHLPLTEKTGFLCAV
ncbi:MAG: ATP-binding protein [Candidatus Aureabacteria bacterium]|nr:ATP-binding protein [Candidatus Auribacterota bacterium]